MVNSNNKVLYLYHVISGGELLKVESGHTHALAIQLVRAFNIYSFCWAGTSGDPDPDTQNLMKTYPDPGQ